MPETDVLEHASFRAMLMAFAYPGRPQAGPADATDHRRLMLSSTWDAGTDDHVVVLTPQASPDTLLQMHRGIEDEPERSTTVLWIASDPEHSTQVDLEGPGVDGRLRVRLPITREQIEARNEACARFPLGIDFLFVGADGAVTGLPRTTRVRLVG